MESFFCFLGIIGWWVKSYAHKNRLRGVWIANNNDKRLSDYFRDQAVLKLNNSEKQIITPPDMLSSKTCVYCFGFLKDWAMVFHLLVTLALIAVFYATIYLKQ